MSNTTHLIRDAIILKASELFKVHPRDIISHHRFDFVTRARFAICKALRMRGWSYAQIGRFLKRDHSTVIHAVKRADYMMEKDPDYAEAVKALSEITVRVVGDD